MKKSRLALVIACFLFGYANLSAKQYELKSPNGEINLLVDVTDKIQYKIVYNNDVLLDNCYLQMTLSNAVLGQNPSVKSAKKSKYSGTINPHVSLKFSTVKNEYNQLRLDFKGNYAVEFRAFDEGVAYRFVTNFPNEVEVMSEDFAIGFPIEAEKINENFSIGFPADYLAHMQQPHSFKTAYEEVYTHVRTKDFVNEEQKICVLPVLLDRKSTRLNSSH